MAVDVSRHGSTLLMHILLFSILFIFCCNATAEWVGISKTKDGIGHFYANPFSIESDDNSLLRIWTLADFEIPQKVSPQIKAFKSYLLQLEINCQKDTARYTSFIVFPENMGIGDAILSNDHEFEWAAIPETGVVKLFANYSCKKLLAKQEKSTHKTTKPEAMQY